MEDLHPVSTSTLFGNSFSMENEYEYRRSSLGMSVRGLQLTTDVPISCTPALSLYSIHLKRKNGTKVFLLSEYETPSTRTGLWIATVLDNMEETMSRGNSSPRSGSTDMALHTQQADYTDIATSHSSAHTKAIFDGNCNTLWWPSKSFFLGSSLVQSLLTKFVAKWKLWHGPYGDILILPLLLSATLSIWN